MKDAIKQPLVLDMILLTLVMSYAETLKINHVFTGLQIHDEYGYWDTTERFVNSMNDVAKQNRTHMVNIEAPFLHLSKIDELGNSLMQNTSSRNKQV